MVLTGGEPLLHSHLDRLVAILREENIRITLLTTGLLLKRHAPMVASNFNDVIISLDGPPEIHDRIRRVPNAFASLQEGIARAPCTQSTYRDGLRMTVQSANHTHLRAAVETAKNLSVNWISFLAADLTSTAFNRETPWSADHQSEIGLTYEQTKELEREIDLLIRDHQEDITSGFIREDDAQASASNHSLSRGPWTRAPSVANLQRAMGLSCRRDGRQCSPMLLPPERG